MATKKGKELAFQPAGDTSRVQSLGGGTYVRIFDHLGKGRHLSVQDIDGITSVVESVTDSNPPLANKIVEELGVLGISIGTAEA